MRGLIALFYLAVAWMLMVIARRMEWDEVGSALRELPSRALLLAALCSTACYLLYGGYELLAARAVGVRVTRPQTAAIGFVSYAFNLNLGAILGALGARLRMYAARGVGASDALRVVAFNLLTNWSGYVFVIGATLLCLVSEAPESWRIGDRALRALGALLVAVYLGYLWACARARRRTITIRGQEIELPTWRQALMQLGLAVPVWLLSAASLYVLLPAEAGYDRVVVTLLFSAVAGLVFRVPAGLGLIEAVFLTSLASVAGASQLLAGLLAYRCIHYLGPLLAGVLGFVVLELLARNGRASTPDAPTAPAQSQPAHG